MASTNDNILMKGYLDKIINHQGTSNWETLYFVLYGPTQKNEARLDWYGNEETSLTRPGLRNGLFMEEITHVERITSKTDDKVEYGLLSQFVFGIFTFRREEPYLIKCADEETLEEWLNQLNITLNFAKKTARMTKEEKPATSEPLYVLHEPSLASAASHEVEVEETAAANREGLHGRYRLVMSRQHLSLVSINDLSNVLSWHYSHVRRFGYSETTFTIEGGQRSENGRGLFILKNCDGPMLFNDVQEKISALKSSGDSLPSPTKEERNAGPANREPDEDEYENSSVSRNMIPSRNANLSSKMIGRSTSHESAIYEKENTFAHLREFAPSELTPCMSASNQSRGCPATEPIDDNCNYETNCPPIPAKQLQPLSECSRTSGKPTRKKIIGKTEKNATTVSNPGNEILLPYGAQSDDKPNHQKIQLPPRKKNQEGDVNEKEGITKEQLPVCSSPFKSQTSLSKEKNQKQETRKTNKVEKSSAGKTSLQKPSPLSQKPHKLTGNQPLSANSFDTTDLTTPTLPKKNWKTPKESPEQDRFGSHQKGATKTTEDRCEALDRTPWGPKISEILSKKTDVFNPPSPESDDEFLYSRINLKPNIPQKKWDTENPYGEQLLVQIKETLAEQEPTYAEIEIHNSKQKKKKKT